MKNTTGTKKWAEVDSTNSVSADNTETCDSKNSNKVHDQVHISENEKKLAEFLANLTSEQRQLLTKLLK